LPNFDSPHSAVGFVLPKRLLRPPPRKRRGSGGPGPSSQISQSLGSPLPRGRTESVALSALTYSIVKQPCVRVEPVARMGAQRHPGAVVQVARISRHFAIARRKTRVNALMAQCGLQAVALSQKKIVPCSRLWARGAPSFLSSVSLENRGGWRATRRMAWITPDRPGSA